MSEDNKELSDEEALMKIAQAMKDNAPNQEEKSNVYNFLNNIAVAEDTTKTAFLRDGSDKNIDELGIPEYNVRGNKELVRIADKIMNNKFFADYFKSETEDTLATSLSREGFLTKQATVQTKQVADTTKRRKVNKGWFGKEKIEETGGSL